MYWSPNARQHIARQTHENSVPRCARVCCTLDRATSSDPTQFEPLSYAAAAVHMRPFHKLLLTVAHDFSCGRIIRKWLPFIALERNAKTVAAAAAEKKPFQISWFLRAWSRSRSSLVVSVSSPSIRRRKNCSPTLQNPIEYRQTPQCKVPLINSKHAVLCVYLCVGFVSSSFPFSLHEICNYFFAKSRSTKFALTQSCRSSNNE